MSSFFSQFGIRDRLASCEGFPISPSALEGCRRFSPPTLSVSKIRKRYRDKKKKAPNKIKKLSLGFASISPPQRALWELLARWGLGSLCSCA